VFKLANDAGRTDDQPDRQEIDKRLQITLANQAVDDVKIFFSSVLMVIRHMYKDYIEFSDYRELQEDIAKMVINQILKDDVLKVLICLTRVETFE
jgi:hypothetical protein